MLYLQILESSKEIIYKMKIVFNLYVFVALFLLLLIALDTKGQSFREIQKVLPPDPPGHDWFGSAVSVSGNYAIVGAFDEDKTIIDGELFGEGAAYIYSRNISGVWNLNQKIYRSGGGKDDRLGTSVDISDKYAVVGAPQAIIMEESTNGITGGGVVLVYERDNDESWQEVQQLSASNYADEDWFGVSVALSGEYLVVGASGKDIGKEDIHRNAGSVYIFKRNSRGKWIEQQQLIASDFKRGDLFGLDISISDKTILIGASRKDTTQNDPYTWLPGIGAAYFFECDEQDVWQETQRVIASDYQKNSLFGSAVFISKNYAIIGAPSHDGKESDNLHSGAAYIFERNENGMWQEMKKLISPEPYFNNSFGHSVAINERYAIVGAFANRKVEDYPNVSAEGGIVGIYQRDDDGEWQFIQKLLPSNPNTSDNFGYALALSGEELLVGSSGIRESVHFFSFFPDVSPIPIPLLYPNPTSQEIQLRYIPYNSEYVLYDQLGRLLQRGIYVGIPLNVSRLSAGIYYLQLNDEQVLKFIKQ